MQNIFKKVIQVQDKYNSSIVFDSRLGFYGTIVIALIAGGLRGNDYAFAVMNIVAGGLAAYTVRDIKNRNQIFRSFLFFC